MGGFHFYIIFWFTDMPVSLPQFEGRDHTLSSSHAQLLTEVPQNTWMEGEHFTLRGRESFPCTPVICIKPWVYGQSLILWLCDRCKGIQECCGVRTMSCFPHPHPLVFEVGMSLVWASVDEGIHLSEKIPGSDVDYPLDCWCRKTSVLKKVGYVKAILIIIL